MPTIFISGAARGLGRAVAEKFLSQGWTVGAFDITPITQEHPNLFSGTLDVTDPDSWESALQKFATHCGGLINVVDNNAGVIADGPLSSLSQEAVKKQIEVNCLGVTLGAQAAYLYLKKSKGQLVNMGSASAIYGQPDIAVYSASKFYVGGLTESLSLEWRKDGIRVIDMWPLWARTELAEVNAPSVRKLGVRISPEQVADSLWRAVNYRSRWARGRIHHGVSALDKILYLGRSLAPDRVARALTRMIAG